MDKISAYNLYRKFTTSDFIENDAFRKFVVDQDEQSISFWNGFIEKHPEKKHEIDEAAKFINGLNAINERTYEEDKHAILEKLNNKIQLDSGFQKKLISLKKHYILRVAASIAVLLTVGSLLLIHYMNQGKSEDVAFHSLKVPKGSRAFLTLEDGTKIWLNAESELKYPKAFSKTERKVILSGEAYFDVTKSKQRPFVVMTRDIKIDVLGTAFNVKAYPDDDLVETTLDRGLINVHSLNISSKSQTIQLKPKQTLRFYKSDEKVEVASIQEEKSDESNKISEVPRKIPIKKIVVVENANTDFYTSWKDDRLVFKSKPLIDLAVILERWYDVNIEIIDNEIDSLTFTGEFKNETVEQALEALKGASKINYEINKNNIKLFKRSD